MKQTRKAFVGTLASIPLAVAALPLAGYSSASAHSSNTSGGISYAFWGSVTEATTMRQMIAAFRKAYPSIPVQDNWIPANYTTKIQTLIAGGAAPDVMQISDGDLPGFVAGFSTVHPDSHVFATWQLVRALTVNGQTYATPLIAKPKVMAINRDLFRKYNVPVPSLHVPLTPAQFQADAIALTHGSGKNAVYGSAPMWIGNMIPAFGGRFFSGDGSTCTIDSPAAIHAAQFMIDAINKYHYSPTAAEAQGQDMLQWFLSQHVAILPDFGPWNLPLMRPVKDIDWDMIPVVGKPLQMEVDGLAISKTSKNPDAAATFVKFMTQSKTAQDILGASPAASGVPVIPASVPAFLKTMPGKNLQGYVDAMMHSIFAGVPRANSNQAWNVMGTEEGNMTPLGTGKQDPSVAFPVIARDVTKVIAGGV